MGSVLNFNMGASLLLSVPRKTIWSHHEKKGNDDDNDGRRWTTTDDGRRTTTFQFLMIL